MSRMLKDLLKRLATGSMIAVAALLAARVAEAEEVEVVPMDYSLPAGELREPEPLPERLQPFRLEWPSQAQPSFLLEGRCARTRLGLITVPSSRLLRLQWDRHPERPLEEKRSVGGVTLILTEDANQLC